MIIPPGIGKLQLHTDLPDKKEPFSSLHRSKLDVHALGRICLMCMCREVTMRKDLHLWSPSLGPSSQYTKPKQTTWLPSRGRLCWF